MNNKPCRASRPEAGLWRPSWGRGGKRRWRFSREDLALIGFMELKQPTDFSRSLPSEINKLPSPLNPSVDTLGKAACSNTAPQLFPSQGRMPAMQKQMHPRDSPVFTSSHCS